MAKVTLRSPRAGMKKLKGSTLALVIVGVLLLIALLAVGVLFFAEIVVPIIYVLLILTAIYFGIHFALKAKQNRKVDAFDDALAAKEGIDDRRREWSGWTAELKKQGIDRYELPFYLLVGEPQSGKSVLLQNSDLHFPFGQSRLSGVGGTRGCDWWFTDEAVILDLAGRLFTHEGGASDQLEWEAFLEMLAEFRPLCPANGILLVVPCDGLASDTPEVCAEKANKIQGALLTLAKKLQAQLPIYMVLTKGDKVFGFAESVHRLDAPKRHEMFGWSRPAEKLEAPFNLEELHEGFDVMVERARTLRSEMTVSARLPEAVGEVDRMFAFPDELAALWPNVEAYARRIFAESALADRLHFRGLYLTSGLQSGIPIARVCGDLLGEAGEADGQALEGLFSKQRAYFIKDLVRKRIFVERGLVRPTEGRVAAARRNAIVGYGVAGAIALASIIGAVVYLSGSDEEVTEVYDQALSSVDDLSERTASMPEMLRVLYEVTQAVEQESSLHEELFQNARGDFEDLYVSVFDNRLFPALRQSAANSHAALLRRAPDSHAAFLAINERTQLLLDEIDLDDGDHRRVLLESVDPSFSQYFPRKDPTEKPFDVAAAIKLRREYGGPDPVYPPGAEDRPALLSMAQLTLDLWDGSLSPGSAWQPGGELGYIIAWQGLEDSYNALNAPDLDDRPGQELLKLCDQYANCSTLLETLQEGLEPAGPSKFSIRGASLEKALFDLNRARQPVAEFLGSRASDDGAWTAYDRLKRFADRALQGAERANIGGPSGNDLTRALTGAVEERLGQLMGDIQVPTTELRNLTEPELLTACLAPPQADWTIAGLAEDLANAIENELVKIRNGKLTPYKDQDLAPRIYLSKIRAAGKTFADRYPTLQSLLSEGTADGGIAPSDPSEFNPDLVADLGRLRIQLAELGDDKNNTWSRKVGDLLEDHFDAVRANWRRTLLDEARETDLDWNVVQALRAAAEPELADGVAANARSLASEYLEIYGEAQLEGWDEYSSDGKDIERLIDEVNQHFTQLLLIYETPEQLAKLQYYKGWRGAVDANLADLLATMEERLIEVWTLRPLQLERLGLDEAVEEVIDAQSSTSIDERTAKADERGAAILDNRAFSPDTPVFEQLPESADRLAVLSSLKPANTRFKSLSFVRDSLTPLIEELGRRNLDGMALARAIGQYTTVDLPEPEHCLDYFAQSLHTSLLDRALGGVRDQYISSIEQALEGPFRSVFDALYTDDLQGIRALASQDGGLLNDLCELLDRGGWLDTLRTEYMQLSENPEDRFAALRPSDERLKTDPKRRWWDFERFLVELQTFLRGDEDDVSSSELRITFRPLLGSGIWDFKNHRDANVRYFYFPADDEGTWGPLSPVDRMEDKSLQWRMRTGNTFRMRWSKFNNTNTDYNDGDARLEFTGVLAPLLLCWIEDDLRPGQQEWQTKLTPEGSTRKAPFALLFKPRVLPERPPKP